MKATGKVFIRVGYETPTGKAKLTVTGDPFGDIVMNLEHKTGSFDIKFTDIRDVVAFCSLMGEISEEIKKTLKEALEESNLSIKDMLELLLKDNNESKAREAEIVEGNLTREDVSKKIDEILDRLRKERNF